MCILTSSWKEILTFTLSYNDQYGPGFSPRWTDITGFSRLSVYIFQKNPALAHASAYYFLFLKTTVLSHEVRNDNHEKIPAPVRIVQLITVVELYNISHAVSLILILAGPPLYVL